MPSLPSKWDRIPSLRDLLAPPGGLPGMRYRLADAENVPTLYTHGWLPVDGLNFPIVVFERSAQLLCQGTPIRGCPPHSVGISYTIDRKLVEMAQERGVWRGKTPLPAKAKPTTPTPKPTAPSAAA